MISADKGAGISTLYFGNPATITAIILAALGLWLCAPAFRRVYLYRQYKVYTILYQFSRGEEIYLFLDTPSALLKYWLNAAQVFGPTFPSTFKLFAF